jgi:hypothetical protein
MGTMKVNRGPVLSEAILCLVLVIALSTPGWTENEKRKAYVGSSACLNCHQEEYFNFQAYAKKAHSYESIKKMKKGLTDAEFHKCFECHTTGYKKPGGFVSEEETANLKDAGCEACHGPGSLHVETEDPEDIKGKLTPKDCEVCHNAERVRAFNYKPLVFGGAH